MGVAAGPAEGVGIGEGEGSASDVAGAGRGVASHERCGTNTASSDSATTDGSIASSRSPSTDDSSISSSARLVGCDAASDALYRSFAVILRDNSAFDSSDHTIARAWLAKAGCSAEPL